VGRAIETALSPEGMNLNHPRRVRTAEQTVFPPPIFTLRPEVAPRTVSAAIWPAEGKYEDADLENVANRIREGVHRLRVAGVEAIG